MDIYKDKQREEMLKGDEITAAESSFMVGRELKVGRKKKDLWLEKKKAKDIQLTQKEHQEDWPSPLNLRLRSFKQRNL